MREKAIREIQALLLIKFLAQLVLIVLSFTHLSECLTVKYILARLEYGNKYLPSGQTFIQRLQLQEVGDIYHQTSCAEPQFNYTKNCHMGH